MNHLDRRTALRTFPLGVYLFAGVFALRLVVLVRLTNSLFLVPSTGDMQFYNLWALRILRGNWTEHSAFYGLPLYAYLLAGLYKIFGFTPFIPGFLQAALEAGTATILYKLGARVFTGDGAEGGPRTAVSTAIAPARGEMIGLCAAIGWAFFQPAEAYSVILMPTAWLVFIFWFVVWQIVRRTQAPGWLGILFLGALIGFTAMGVGTILFLVPLLIAALVFKWSGRPSRRAASAAVLLAGVALGTSPAWLHNYFVARDPVFLSAHGGVNFWIGNNPLATGYPKFPPGLHAGQEAMLKDSITAAEKVAGHPLKRSEVSAFWSQKARDWIRQHPGDWVKLLGTKIKNFWSAFQYDDLSIITALRDQFIILPGLSFGLVAALGLPGLLRACARFPAARWITAAIFLHMASLLTVFVTERYRLAAVPGLLLFAAFGICELWQNIAGADYRRAGIFLLLLFCSTAFVSLPQKEPSLWALDTYNSGLQALESHNLSLARQKLGLAYAYSPENAEINFAEGNLHLALNDKPAAKSFYLAALHLDPHHSGVHNNLGVLALEESRWDLAAKFFQHALEESPNDAKLYYLLAQARLKSGDPQGARNAIGRALQLDPARPEFVSLQREIEQATHPHDR